ncbi:Na+/H+ antiporter subunit E [Mycolicibacterium elephantis]|uniref:Na+/H+ antiporter subunit E n=1 Tax=Mycolicibacterium elephantis TaxID=81858 RepID=A0A1X0D1A8_9MYCO|nr:Na+/H+ antiporter subunit E [Mycolicibacterium elephantis]MCV7220020.1 Na+/H+ antiporter subunit E [Mycolicibacterium elephantis]OBA82917.1 Na+/H+ antiporter subunit E [Mycolicibacterium elephantis]OBE93504.1 Na+/H+ antiporter subunit E [Mycolicibacterium elephantis]ORA66177.1 Na+/H+ antiporter subunit E [Mycolicibacterium elephantis]
MRAVVLRLSVLLGLILVWMLLWGSISVANFVGGLVVALVITLLLPLPVVPVEGKVHPLSLLRLLIQMVYWLVRSSIQVAWLAVRPGAPPVSAVLRAHFALKSDLVLAMAVNLINLTPGTIALEVDQARRIVYVHVLNANTDRAIQEFHAQMATLERLLKTALERDEDWRPASDKEAA